MTIVSIRGTHGSGKSTIVQKILAKYPHEALFTKGNAKRPSGYLVDLPTGDYLYIPGPYDTPCGGCDAIQPYSNIWPLIDAAVRESHHVLFEGALVSSSYGAIGHSMNGWTDSMDCLFAFLDTPLETCLERIAERRLAKWQSLNKPGLPPPVNPANTAGKFDSVARTKAQMAKLGSAVRAVDIDHTQPVKQIMKLFGVKLTKEPV